MDGVGTAMGMPMPLLPLFSRLLLPPLLPLRHTTHTHSHEKGSQTFSSHCVWTSLRLTTGDEKLPHGATRRTRQVDLISAWGVGGDLVATPSCCPNFNIKNSIQNVRMTWT